MAANVASRVLVMVSANVAQLVAGMNKANKSISFMEASVRTLKNTMLGTFGAYQVLHAIQNTIKVLADFDKEMTAVSVITGSGKLTRGFQMLEKDALRIGSSTKFAAKEVAGLQLEFARLGFSTKEILLSTKATVALATATGEDLPRAAEIAGATLRGFNLDASEMGRVTDVMAKALNESALTLDSFANGMKYVAPVAAALGITIEETSAMLSVLSDAGIKGTMAGTSLRRIFTLLTKDGGDLTTQLDELAKKGITLAQANDEVGLYAQTSLLILTRYKPRLDELAEAMKLAKDETDKMAKLMDQNLDTALVKVNTSYNAWMLSLRNSKGTIVGLAEEISNMFKVGANRGVFETFLRGQAQFHPLSQLIGWKPLSNAGKEIEEEDKNTEKLEEKRQARITAEAKRLFEVYDGNLNNIRIALKGLNRFGIEGTEIYTRVIELETEATNEKIKKIAEEGVAKAELLRINEELAESRWQDYQRSYVSRGVDSKGDPMVNLGTSNAKDLAMLKSYAKQMGMLPDSIKLASTETKLFSQAQAALANNIKMADLKAAGENFKTFEDNTRNLHGALASMASDLGTAFANLGDETRGGARAVARAAISIINTLEQITLARMIADSSKYGLPGILAAAAGFGIVKGIFAKIARGSGGGGGGSSGGGSVRNFDKGIYVSGEFRLAGSTLIAGVDQANYQKSRLG